MISARAAKTVAGSGLSPPGAEPFPPAFDASAMLCLRSREYRHSSPLLGLLGRNEPIGNQRFMASWFQGRARGKDRTNRRDRYLRGDGAGTRASVTCANQGRLAAWVM